METVEDDEDEPVIKNNAPHNKNHVRNELADDSSDDDRPQVVNHRVRVTAKNVVSLYIY